MSDTTTTADLPRDPKLEAESDEALLVRLRVVQEGINRKEADLALDYDTRMALYLELKEHRGQRLAKLDEASGNRPGAARANIGRWKRKRAEAAVQAADPG
jgi:hypothetical protein